MSKNNHSKVGQIISNDPTGRVLDPDEVIEGNSYKAAALPVGTKVSFVEKIPGKSCTGKTFSKKKVLHW